MADIKEKAFVSTEVRQSSVDAETARLEGLGYKQELNRSLGMVSILGLSFAIMAVPYGSSTTLNIALTDGGPVTVLWGVSIPWLCFVGNAGLTVGSGCSCPASRCVSRPVWRKCECPLE